jgi:signal peptidase I
MRLQREAALTRTLGERGVALRQVTGTSMVPSLKPGEMVFVEPCSDPRPGDIVAFALHDGLLVHRVVKVAGSWVTCRGDNRLVDDPPVPREAVLGKVVQIAGRKRVPDGRRDVARVRLRLMRYRAGARFRSLGGEARLFAAQAGLGTMPPFAPPLGTMWDEGDPDAASGGLLRPPERFDRESVAAAAPPHDPVVIPAGIFCRVPAEERRELLLGLGGRSVVVWALSMSAAGRRVRLLAAIRVVLSRLGMVVGEPGDMYLPPGLDSPGGRAHSFDEDELRGALSAAGGHQVTVEPRMVRGVLLLRGRADLARLP